MERPALNPIRLAALALAAAVALEPPAFAGDVSVRLDAGAGFSVKDSSGGNERLRVDESTGNVSRNGSLFLHTTGTENLFVGPQAGNTATTGPGGNTAFGYGALFSNTTGFSNSAFGDQALFNNTTGSENSALGSYSLFNNTAGDRNLAFGPGAGENLASGSDNLYLANPGVAVESGRIRIGTDLTHTAIHIAGIHGVDTGSGGLPVLVNANGQLGTGGGSQAPWTGAIDAAGYGISDLAPSMFTDLSVGASSSAFLGANEAGKGWGWKFGIAAGSQHNTPLGLDTTYTASFNSDAAGGGINADYLHSIIIGNEAAWVPIGVIGSNSAPGPQAEFHTDFYTKTSTWELGSLSGTLSDAEVFAIRREGGAGHIVAVGRSRGYSAPDLSIDWYPITAKSDPPVAGDHVETASTTTVTGLTGDFADGGVAYLISAAAWTGTCISNLGEAAIADTGIALIFDAEISGDPLNIRLIQTRGTQAQFTPGAHLCEKNGTGSAVLETVTPDDAAVLVGSPDNSYSSQRMGPTWDYKFFEDQVSWHLILNGNETADGRYAMDAGADANGLSYVTFLGNGNGGLGSVPNIQFGDPVEPVILGLHGDLWQSDWNGQYGIQTMDDLTDTRIYTWPDAAGTVVVLDTTGCDPDDPILAGATPGLVKCGTPGGGMLASAGPSLAGGLSISPDASGDLTADSARSGVDQAPTLAPFMDGPDEFRFYEASRGREATDSIALRSPRAASRNLKRGPVIGALSNGSSHSTPEELCDVTYFQSSGEEQACIAGTAKRFDPTTAVASWIGCGDEVPTSTYFETVCSVD